MIYTLFIIVSVNTCIIFFIDYPKVKSSLVIALGDVFNVDDDNRQSAANSFIDVSGELHSVISDETKAHTCTICGKEFMHKSSLKRHLSVHSGKRPFSCTICGKSFFRKDSCAEHTRLHFFNNSYV